MKKKAYMNATFNRKIALKEERELITNVKLVTFFHNEKRLKKWNEEKENITLRKREWM